MNHPSMKRKATRLLRGRRSKKPLRLAKPSKWAIIDEAVLFSDSDGVIRCKDGRRVEDYINDPRLIHTRKKFGVFDITITDLDDLRKRIIPHIA